MARVVVPENLRDAVLAVHDVAADREVVEEAVDVARTRARRAVHAAPSGEVALAPHDDLGVVEAEARRQRALEHADAHVEHLVGIGRDLESLARAVGRPCARPPRGWT